MTKEKLSIVLYLILLTVIFYLPVIITPSILLNRGNDLQQYFWPLFYFTKQFILTNHSLPLWNNLFLSGAPLLPDPQSFLFYLPNLLFLALPLDQGIIASLILHTFAGGLGSYLAGRLGFKFSRFISLFIASLYIVTPRSAGYLEAGHFGLVVSLAWLPFILLSTIKIAKKPTILWSIVLALTLSQVYYSHTITFLVASISSLGIFLSTIFFNQFKKWPTALTHFILGVILTFGLMAITLLPQLEWTPKTTRSLLLSSPQTYPQWFSFKEVGQIIFYPWSLINGSFWSIDTEKWISLGLMPLVLAVFGYLKINRKLQIIIAVIALVITLLALNNLSPFYHLFLSQDWYKMIRVSTRFWIIAVFVSIFLSGFAIEQLSRKKSFKKIVLLITTLALVESLALSWGYLFKPVYHQKQFASSKVLQFLKADREKYRVFCINRCISQQDAAINNLELIEGYSTLQQLNYFKQTWQLTGGFWNYYTLAIPPIGLENFQKLNPDADSLGEYNVKYIISPYELRDKNLVLKDNIDEFFIYQNLSFLPRAYFKTSKYDTDFQAPIIFYSPNYIRVDTSKNISQQLILAEVYSEGWKAYLNGKEETKVEQTPIALRLVNIKSDTTFIDFKYQPDSFKIGRTITSLTVLIIGVLLWKQVRSKHHQ